MVIDLLECQMCLTVRCACICDWQVSDLLPFDLMEKVITKSAFLHLKYSMRTASRADNVVLTTLCSVCQLWWHTIGAKRSIRRRLHKLHKRKSISRATVVNATSLIIGRVSVGPCAPFFRAKFFTNEVWGDRERWGRGDLVEVLLE